MKTNDPQIKTTAYLKENSAGGEILSFVIRLGPYFQIPCIVNIPGQGEKEAPAYIKFKLHNPDIQDLVEERGRDLQIKITARLMENKAGGEILTFLINLEHFQLACIVNIPGQGETSAPAYVKFKIRPPRRDFTAGYTPRDRNYSIQDQEDQETEDTQTKSSENQ